MPTVDENRLKGNYGEAYVAALLSSQCLVRPVAQGTDVGVDLYCESVEENTPFLHFWVQVKTVPQCKVAASYPFEVVHLKYWARQPVPVFAALVPVGSPVQEDPDVHVVDVTSWLLEAEMPQTKKVRLPSKFIWRPRNPQDIQEFLENVVPEVSARLQCKQGIVGTIPTVHPQYVKKFPRFPVSKYQEKILQQIRRTAAFSIWFLHVAEELGGSNAEFRKKLAQIVEQFEGDIHWENFTARALSHHADGEFEQAVGLYQRATRCIREDRTFREQTDSQPLLERISELQELAEQKRPISGRGANNSAEPTGE